jgi:hypothetical protein
VALVIRVETVSSATAYRTTAVVVAAEPDQRVARIAGFKGAGLVSVVWVFGFRSFQHLGTEVGSLAVAVDRSTVMEHITLTAGGVVVVTEAVGTTALRPPLERPTRVVVAAAHAIKVRAVRAEPASSLSTILPA